MPRRDRTSNVLLGIFLASTLVLMTVTATSVVPEDLGALALLGWFACLVVVVIRAARPGGRTRVAVEMLLGAVIVLLLTGATVAAASLRQDAAAERAAVAGFERSTGHHVLDVWDLFRAGSCAVVWAHYEGEPDLADLTAVVVTRKRGSWHLSAISHETGDADNFSDESDCRAFAHDG